VRNLCGERHDLWALNTDDEYQEEIRSEDGGTSMPGDAIDDIASTQPSVPQPMTAAREH
jgi:hypothetical protein